MQLLFGTDARYIHSLGMRLPGTETGLYQGDVPEAYLSLHLPILTEGGVDVKLGKFITLEGAETIDPRTSPFTRTPTFSTLASQPITPARSSPCTPTLGSISSPA